MRTRSPLDLGFVFALGLVACGSTGQSATTYQAEASGTGVAMFAAGSWQVTLTTARVGFGPIYFCASASSSRDTCPSAVAEISGATALDALSPTAQPLGDVTAVAGEARSAIYDYAYVWRLTESAPRPLAAAPDGHSAHFEGTAVRGPQTVRFIADVDVLPSFAGTLAVQGAQVAPTAQAAGLRLDVLLDPAAWWSAVDFDEMAAAGADPVTVGSTTRAYNALVLGMTSTARPRITWSKP